MASQQTAANSGIAYDPELIVKLESEHRMLKQQLKLMGQLIAEKQFGRFVQILEEFRSSLVSHVFEENLKLYIYLQHSLKDKPDQNGKMRALRKRVDDVGIEVIDFLDKYKDVEMNPQIQTTILEDFEHVNAIYLARIQIEEDELFSMYLP